MSQSEEEGLLSRWSRRKLQTQEETVSEDEILAMEQPDAVNAIGVNEQPAEEQPAEEHGQPVLTDEDMPPVESLTEESDFSAFMSSGVSDKLRNMALRKMFHAPVFNIRDGLDEYDEDYTFFEPLGDIVTSDMKHQIEMRELKRLEEAEAEAKAEAELEAAEEPVEAELEQVDNEDDESELIDDEPGQSDQSELTVEKPTVENL